MATKKHARSIRVGANAPSRDQSGAPSKGPSELEIVRAFMRERARLVGTQPAKLPQGAPYNSLS